MTASWQEFAAGHRSQHLTPFNRWCAVVGNSLAPVAAVAALTGRPKAAAMIFAAGTAVSMAFLSTAFGVAIARGPVGRNFERLVPALGALGVAFGAWYMLGALGVVAYPL